MVGSFHPHNSTVLNFTLCLTLSITLAQIIAALYSNSLALMADAVSMGVDAFTYMINRYAESQRGTEGGVLIEFVAAATSVVALFCITTVTIMQATKRIVAIKSDNDSTASLGGVDMRYVLAFGILGIVFDSLSLTCFYFNDRGHEAAKKAAATRCYDVDIDLIESQLDTMQKISSSDRIGLGHSSSSEELVKTPPLTRQLSSERADEGRLNMRSALTHSVGDLLRSSATIVSAVVSLVGNVDPAFADAVCAIVFSILIGFGGIHVAKDLWQKRTKLGTYQRRSAQSNGKLPRVLPVAVHNPLTIL